jgi:DsbC/DsbD-like thiol-disulfide interchange protein
MLNNKRILILTFFFCSFVLINWGKAGSLNASPVAKVKGDYGSVEIIDGWQKKNGEYQTSLLFLLNPGWKTYWRNPGESGLKPSFDWSKSQNLDSANVLWPHPLIFNETGIVIYGFKSQLLLPILIKPDQAFKNTDLNLKLEFGVCSEICIPILANLSKPNIGNGSQQEILQIRKAINDLPKIATEQQRKKIKCKIEPKKKIINLAFKSNLITTIKKNTYAILEYNDPSIWFTSQTSKLVGKDLFVSANINQFNDTNLMIDRNKVQITLINEGSNLTVLGCKSLTFSTEAILKN